MEPATILMASLPPIWFVIKNVDVWSLRTAIQWKQIVWKEMKVLKRLYKIFLLLGIQTLDCHSALGQKSHTADNLVVHLQLLHACDSKWSNK